MKRYGETTRLVQLDLTRPRDAERLARADRALIEETEGTDGRLPAFNLDQAARGWAAVPDGLAVSAFVAVDDGGEPVGYSLAMWPANTPVGATCSLTVHVQPSWRRRHIGAALMRAALETVPDSCGPVVSEARFVPAPDGVRPTGMAFAEVMGLRCSDVSQHYVHAWPQDPDLLDRLDPTAPGPDGSRGLGQYVIRTYVDGVPDELAAGLGVLMGMVDTEAPTGDRVVEPHPVSPEAYRSDVARCVALGGHRVETLALDEERVVAFNALEVPADADDRLLVRDTLVERGHRVRRLGLAVKVAGERALLAMDLPQRSIRTRTSDANSPMRRLNERLGFVPLFTQAELDGERSVLLTRATEASAATPDDNA